MCAMFMHPYLNEIPGDKVPLANMIKEVADPLNTIKVPFTASTKLTRAEMRRQKHESSKKTATYNFTEEQLKQVIDKEVNNIVRMTNMRTSELIAEMFMVYSFYVLHEEFKFGKDRLLHFKEKVDYLADNLVAEEVTGLTNEDLVLWCQENIKGLDMTPLLHKLGVYDIEEYHRQQNIRNGIDNEK